jgi:hypothetical protein
VKPEIKIYISFLTIISMLMKANLIDTLGLGIALWLMGFVASIMLWGIVSPDMIGWVLFAIFLPLTLYVPYRRFRKRKESVKYYLFVSATWMLIAIAFDYMFIVRLFSSTNYYKLDVFVYYAATFLAPFLIGVKYGTKS